MKILEIVFSLSSGGAERFVVDICNRYSRKNENEVVLLTLLDIRKPENAHYLKDLSPKVRQICTFGKRGYSLGNIWKTLWIIYKEKPEVVHAHCGVFVLLLPSLLIRKIKYFHTIHSLAQRYSPGMLKKLLSKYAYNHGLITPITISYACHRSYQDYYGLNNDVLIENGCEPLGITVKSSIVKAEIANYKKNNETPVFIHVARHHPIKNHNRLFYVFENLLKNRIDFQLIVIGDNYGLLHDKYSNNENIHLLGYKDNIGDYMAMSDFFVLSSDAEGLPITLLEAMSMGVIPICTPVGGIVDVVKDGYNGFLSHHVDDESFYESVRRALINRKKIDRKTLIDEFKEKYSMEMCSKKYYKLYETIS